MADHVASELVGVAPRDGDVAHVEGAGVATNSDSSTSTDAQSEDNSNPRFHAKTFLILVTCALLYFTQLGFIISTGAFGRSIASVIGGADKVSWLVDSTAITVVVLSVPINVAADYWGRRWFIIVLTALGFTGCFVLASSKNITVAIVGAVLGSLGGCTVSLVHAIASEVLPRKYRMLGQALLNAGAALGGIFALMIGGLLTRSNPHGFRTFFYIFGGIYAASTVVVFLFYTPPPRPLQTTLTQREKLAKMDWIGSILLGIGGTLISVALSWAENPYPWNSAHILATLFVGVTAIAALAIYEWKGRTDGLFHHGLYSRNRNFLLASLCIFAEGIVFYAAAGYFVYEVQTVFESRTILSLFHFGLNFIIFGTTVPIVGIYASKTKKVRLPMIVAFASFLTFNITMATLELGSKNALWGYIVFLAIGMSMGLTTVMTAAQLSAPPELISHCTGLIICLRSLGGVVGLAIYGAILNSNINNKLGKDIAKAVLPLGLPETSLGVFIGDLAAENVEAIAKIPGVTPEIIEAGLRGLKKAYLDSFRLVWITAAAFTVVALVCAIFTFNPVQDLTMEIDAPAEKKENIYGPRKSSRKSDV